MVNCFTYHRIEYWKKDRRCAQIGCDFGNETTDHNNDHDRCSSRYTRQKPQSLRNAL